MSPREEFHTVQLPKGWTPAKIMEYAKVVDLLNRNGQLAAEVRALRRERRELRAALRVGLTGLRSMSHGHRASAAHELEKALAPKARRRKA